MRGTFGATDKTFYFFGLRRTVERPFYYTVPNPISLFPQRSVEDVIICGLSIEQPNGTYDPTGEWLQHNAQTEPHKRLSELVDGESILLAPLGESPMVVTQTYILLQKHEGRQVSHIVVLYPQGHAPARNAANLLAGRCDERGISFEKRPIKLKDVDSDIDCKTYLDALIQTINDLRARYPDKQIALSLSGGRKGMSALTLFAAQRAGIEQVYHTVIIDPKLEDQIERECSLKGLEQFTPFQQAERLFLNIYDHAQFDLFSIPVIPIE
jgi:CRISPR-associated Csx14 family protein